MRHKTIGIQKRTLAAVLGTALLAFVVFGVGEIIYQTSQIQPRVRQSLESSAELIRGSTCVAIEFGDPARVQEILTGLQLANAQIQRTDIIGSDGPLATYPANIPPLASSVWSRTNQFRFNHDYAELVKMLPTSDPAKPVLLSLRMSLAEINRSQRKTLVEISLMAGLMLFIVALMQFVLMQRWVLSPLAQLAAIADNAGKQGDYSPRMPAHNRDELGLLGQSFNELLAAVQQRETELRRLSNFQRAILNDAAYSIISTDTAGIITSINPAGEKLTDWKAGELIGKVSAAIFHLPAEIAARAEQLTAKLGEPIPAGFETLVAEPRRGARSEAEWNFVKKDGSCLQVLLSVSALRDDHGDIFGFLGIVVDITARKLAEAQMNLQLSAMTAAANAIMITDRGGKIEWVNPAFSQLTGYSAVEAIGNNPRILKSGVHSAEFYAQMWSAITAGHVWHEELVNKRKDGSFYHEVTTITPVRVNHGQITHFVSTKEDITSRKQTERFLSFIAQEGWSDPQEDYLERLVEYIGRTLAVTSAFIGRVKDDQTVHTTGFYAEGRVRPNIEYSIDGTPTHNVIGKALCHYGDHLRELFPHAALPAEMKAESFLGIPLMDSAGRALGLLAILDDKPMPDARLATTMLQIAAVRVAGEIERRAKVDELHWKTALMEAQMEAAPDGILMIDNQGRRILQNQRMNDLLKIPPHISGNEDNRVQLAFIASRAKDPGAMKDKVAYLYAHPDEISRDELEFVDGTIVDRYSSPVRDKNGASCGRIWIFRDITQARQLEMQLRQSQKMEGIGQLAGGVAHDFNNILAALLMQTDLIEMVEPLPDEVVEGLQQIRADANRAAELTRQLLLFSRRQVMQASVFDLNELVTNLAKMLQRIIGEDIQLQLHLHATPLLMRADAGMIDQIIMNLAVNARDAMSTGGRLRIETEQKHVTDEMAGRCPDAVPGDYDCLSVSDTGGGIPQDILPKIFEPFFTTKAAGKGTGLGLATVFGIVKQHRGWIKVDNRPGSGVTFRVFLPATSEGASHAAKVEPRIKPIGGKETILLVEDEPAVRKLICTMLQRRGYDVLAASNGNEAVDLCLAPGRKVALLLTDLVLPGGMTGHELARKLQSRQSNLKIVFMSGYSPEIAGREIELSQGENFVQKPFAADRLLETIRRSLDG